MKKIKINYLLIGVIILLLAVALWPTFPWLGKTENRIAVIKSRGVLHVSTINSPLTYNIINNRASGLDYELARQFADYLGVKLVINVRTNIDDLFDDLDHGRADILAAGLMYNSQRSLNYQPGPAYYSVSQQLVYRVGNPRPSSFGNIKKNQLILPPGIAALNELKELQKKKHPNLSWRVDKRHSSTQLLQQVVNGSIVYTIADSIAISIFQRVHPQLAVALDVTDERPVTWFSARSSTDDSLSAALLDFYSKLSGEGILARLEEKYLGHVGDFDYVDTRTFLRAIDSVLPSLKPLFIKYATSIDWRLLAAISYQESHWDNLATSPTGVRGLMMLTKNTAQSVGITDRLDAEQSIRGGSRYLQDMMKKVPSTVPDDERIWFALAAYNMGYLHMLDARQLTAKQNGNPDSWADVKMRLPLLSQKAYYSQTTYGYARGHEAYAYVENIRRYQLSLVGYLQEKEKHAAQIEKFAEAYPAVSPGELNTPTYESLPLRPFFQDGEREKSRSVTPNRSVPAYQL